MKYIDDMLEGYLDSEEKYWDYGTGVISGNNVIDRYHTGISFYDQFFDPSEFKYLRDNKNLQGKVVMMTPEEYYEECAKYCWPGKNITPDSLKRQRSWDTDVIEKLKNVIFKYKRKLCMPMINYADPSQEGLHRMYVIGEIYGWDFKVPVLQVRHADEDRAKRAAEEKRKSEIDWKVERAISDTLLYKFSDTEDFKSELRHHLYTQFQFSDDIKIPENLQLEEIDEAFILSIAGYEYPIEKDEIKWAESSKDELDDLDLDDTEDFLIRYFGDDWRETYPHLKDKFHITESVEKQLPKYLYHATYRNRWNAIKKSGGLKTHVRKRYWDDSRDVICMSEDPWVAESYAEEADDASDYELDNIVILKIDTSALDLDYLDIDGNILRDDDEELKNTEYEYSKDIPITAISLFNKKLDLVEPSIIQSNELEEDFSNNNEFLHSLLDELSEFDYAFIGANGEELDDKEAMNAVVQHPYQFNRLRKGVCTDFVEYTSEKLSEHNIDHDVYFIKCVDKDGDEPSHVFVVVEDKGKFLWVEAAWYSESGIHKYSSLEKLFEDIARKHCVYEGHNYLKSCEIRKIKKSLAGMSQRAIYDYVDTLPITWKATEEGITESLKQIDYLPVSDVELFKEYADDILDGYGNMSDTDIKSSIKEIHFEGKLAGYIGFSEYEENGSKCLGIGNFMIIERGKGLGSAVIQNIVEKYKDQYDLIYCFVDAKNDGAIRLYKKLGKVYDEDGPNNNGEYYVTFWDNGKWELEEDFENNLELVFLSDKNMNGKTLTPRVPNNFLIKNGYEDSTTPRICFASSIDKALMAISRNLKDEELYVHQPKNVNKKAIYKPTVKEVPDVKITGEVWYTEPVELECVGKIHVIEDDGKDGLKYTYGNNAAELYGWNWEWIEN